MALKVEIGKPAEFSSWDERSLSDEEVEQFLTSQRIFEWHIPNPIAAECRIPSNEAHLLLLMAEQLRCMQSFEELQCWNQVRISRFPHQIETALKVLNEMNGCALLADDVGLGKTIEAGLVMKELIVRGLVKSVLILVPASLTHQWCHEMFEKFGERFFIASRENDWLSYERIIGSIDLAKREPHRSAILRRQFDLLIVDEAHKLRNRLTLAHRFCQKIQKRYVLLLTATPIQNNLFELYNLVTLIKPGQLGTLRNFKRRYVLSDDPKKPKNVGELRRLLSSVMIRHHRDEVGITLPPRYVTTHYILLTPPEFRLYEEMTMFLRQSYKRFCGASGKERHMRLTLILLQKELCSTPQAVAGTLLKMAGDDYPGELREKIAEFFELARTIPLCAKIEHIKQLLSALGEKVLIFTDYIASMKAIKRALEEHGHEVVLYHGGMSEKAKDRAIERFKESAGVMISTESGAEGRNLQFCRVVINFDLPWNPMRLEQRIGRVHRLGQDKPVFVINLATEQTVEEHIIEVLITKIGLFELTVGELELMLGISHLEEGIERLVAEAIMQSETPEEEKERLRQVGKLLQRAVERYERVRQANQMFWELIKQH
ncbi:MAG: SNF2-related protein [Armatimonadota bacterium]|nr:DEAD/DEAH box helicase [Armatimonadota bacterium]MCX7776687.1 DEAD/DEAH box helicase [Armatimonadota bacterium]MDW8025698.1 SNF2-related protein [Armatimonadota bacterium]